MDKKIWIKFVIKEEGNNQSISCDLPSCFNFEQAVMAEIDWNKVWKEFEQWSNSRFPFVLLGSALNSPVCQKVQQLVESQLKSISPEEEKV